MPMLFSDHPDHHRKIISLPVRVAVRAAPKCDALINPIIFGVPVKR